MSKRILIDCTYVYYSELNTGIQRVVRNIAKNSKMICLEKNIDLELVILEENKIKRIDEIPVNILKKQSVFFTFLKNIYNLFRNIIIKILPFSFVSKFFYATKDQFGFRFLVEHFILKPLKGEIPFSKNLHNHNLQDIELSKNDILLLLDSTWHNEIFESLKYSKKHQLKIITVIYDLIPLSHPQFCDESLSYVFKSWLDTIVKYSDGFLAISNTVKNDTIKYLSKSNNIDIRNFDYFLLGSDFNKKEVFVEKVRDSLKKIFTQSNKNYIIVSTIEPRKNHIQILRVFEQLWNDGFDSNLIIVGKIGWKVEKLIYKIKKSKFINKKLFMFNDIDDNELQYLYDNVDTLIFPSIIEGYGLPIIESLNNNLSTLVSDTEIHREVGRDSVTYFSLDDDNDLKEKILIMDKSENLNNINKIDIPSWYECTQNIIEKVLILDKKISNERV